MDLIFDTHAHYDDEAFDEDRESLLSSMQENGIGRIVNIGASLASCRRTIELMEQYDFVYGALGVHPSDTAELDEESFHWLEEVCQLKKCLAVGEIGLDYYWDEPDRDTQKRWLVRQLHLAEKIGKPVVIHSREAAKDTIDIMKAEHCDRIGGVIHCYSYTKESARDYLEMGYYFGIGGVVTFNNARKLKEAVEYLPLDRIVLETDCPYLAPVPHRGKTNTPVLIEETYKFIAEARGILAENLSLIVDGNIRKLFRI